MRSTKAYVGKRGQSDVVIDDPATEIPTDPPVVLFWLRRPDGAGGYEEIVYQYGVDAEIVRTATGSYHVEWAFIRPGYWQTHWQALYTSDDPETSMASEPKTYFVGTPPFTTPTFPAL